MANFVLVHGAAHGAWCWSRVLPMLRAKGHEVVAVDLPGNGSVGDCTPLDQVDLGCYVHHVCSLLDQFESPVVLVGHSLGGLTISQAGELRPDKISTLVYLSALLLQPGEAFRSVMSDDPKRIRQGLERDSWAISDDLAYVTFHADMARHRFYNDCSPEDVDWALGLLVPQPTGPLMGHLEITKANFGRIPRFMSNVFRTRRSCLKCKKQCMPRCRASRSYPWTQVTPRFCPIHRVWVIICFPWSEYGGNSRMGL